LIRSDHIELEIEVHVSETLSTTPREKPHVCTLYSRLLNFWFKEWNFESEFYW